MSPLGSAAGGYVRTREGQLVCQDGRQDVIQPLFLSGTSEVPLPTAGSTSSSLSIYLIPLL